MKATYPNLFKEYCDCVRETYDARGILIYNGKVPLLLVAGWPYCEKVANNDNEAKP